jgi:hypothetical protein
MDKPVLFYSNFCPFSKDVIQYITKKHIRHLLILICVDDKQLRIPAYVDRVPMIMTRDKQILCDDDLLSFMESILASPNVSDQTMELTCYTTGSFSDEYSFIDDTNGSKPTSMTSYSQLTDMMQINTPPELERQKGEGFTLDKLVQTRTEDINKILQTSPPPFP